MDISNNLGFLCANFPSNEDMEIQQKDRIEIPNDQLRSFLHFNSYIDIKSKGRIWGFWKREKYFIFGTCDFESAGRASYQLTAIVYSIVDRKVLNGDKIYALFKHISEQKKLQIPSDYSNLTNCFLKYQNNFIPDKTCIGFLPAVTDKEIINFINLCLSKEYQDFQKLFICDQSFFEKIRITDQKLKHEYNFENLTPIPYSDSSTSYDSAKILAFLALIVSIVSLFINSSGNMEDINTLKLENENLKQRIETVEKYKIKLDKFESANKNLQEKNAILFNQMNVLRQEVELVKRNKNQILKNQVNEKSKKLNDSDLKK